MHEAPGRTWREIADQHHSALLNELEAAFETRISESVQQAVEAERREGDERTETARREVREETTERTRRAVADGLNQILRRLRQAPSKGGVLKLAAEASAGWAGAVVVLLLEEGQARPVASRGLADESALAPVRLVEEGLALNSVIETGDPVTALVTPAELSASLAAAVGDYAQCQLLPITVRGSVTAILVAAEGQSTTGALELLTEAVGMRLETLDVPAAPVLKPLEQPGLVQITKPAEKEPEPRSEDAKPQTAERKWADLSPEEQKDHLAAQRIARVRVAEMRLYHAEELRQGVFSGSIYGALRSQIDQARKDFLQNCLSKSATMVDYLHVEILRSLAHDDERLLGSDYPGPMV